MTPPDDRAEFLRYCVNAFPALPGPLALPLADEPFVAAWVEYAREAESNGAWQTLSRKLPPLQFPVAEGISQSAEYRAATRRGVPGSAQAPALERPEAFSFFLHPTAAGRIPVLTSRHRPDFVRLVQALAHRNEPVRIPDSQGACMVAGLNNWDRIHRLRGEFLAANLGAGEAAFREEFTTRIKPRPELYQDRLIILSDGPYSGVSADAMEMSEAGWRETSLTIRREHECAHYFTKRVFGVMRNHAHDEILADYAGIIAAAGKFRPEWFLRFFGLENFPRYRRGARLENYLGDPPLGEGAFRLLQQTATGIARRLAEIPAASLPVVLVALAQTGLADMGSAALDSALAAAGKQVT